MEPFRYHVFLCNQQKPEGLPSCSARGSSETLEALRLEIAAHGLEDVVQITTCGSLGLCESGPNMVVYPEGVWYSRVTAADVPELVRSHFQGGKPLERLARTDAAEIRAEMQANRGKRLAAIRAREAGGGIPDELNEHINERIRAFQESRAILTALELDIFTAVGGGSTAAETAAKLSTNPRATEMLMNAVVSLRLLDKRGEVFHNTPVAARYLVATSPHSARLGLLHTASLWKNWSTLTECVRTGASVAHVELEERSAEWTQAFIAAMHRNAAERVPMVVQAVGAGGIRRMLDIGGGSGAYSIAFAQANPALESYLLDLPAVVPIAQRHIDQAGVGNRVHLRTGDLRTGHLGEGYDLAYASAICHMLSPNENRDLLRRCYEALVPGGRMVIQEFILDADKTAPTSAALFALNMLVGTRAGASYSEPEFTSWLREAGFHEIRRVHLPGPAGLMIGTRL
jgi:(2Fe-2S) ferredoxin/predicted O-methyltransferase YrrM